MRGLLCKDKDWGKVAAIAGYNFTSEIAFLKLTGQGCAPLAGVTQHGHGDGILRVMVRVGLVLHHVLQPEIAVVEAEPPLRLVKADQHLPGSRRILSQKRL